MDINPLPPLVWDPKFNVNERVKLINNTHTNELEKIKRAIQSTVLGKPMAERFVFALGDRLDLAGATLLDDEVKKQGWWTKVTLHQMGDPLMEMPINLTGQNIPNNNLSKVPSGVLFTMSIPSSLLV